MGQSLVPAPSGGLPPPGFYAIACIEYGFNAWVRSRPRVATKLCLWSRAPAFSRHQTAFTYRRRAHSRAKITTPQNQGYKHDE